MSKLKCKNWDSFEPELVYDGDRCIGTLMPRATQGQLAVSPGVQAWSTPLTETRVRPKSTRAGTLVDPKNYDGVECWYRLGDRIAWYDRYIGLWTVYDIEPGTKYQTGACRYYNDWHAVAVGEADASE